MPSPRRSPVLAPPLLAVITLAVLAPSVHARRAAPRVPAPVVDAQALSPLGASACDPPFAGDHCPPPPGTPGCRARETARSRDGTVTAEIVEDGHPLGLLAVHLVVRDGSRAHRLEHLGERGVGCGTFEMFGASYDVESLRVADVLFGPRPEVILVGRNTRGRELVLCSTDVTPPACTRGDITALPRFRRPDVVLAGRERFRPRLPVPAP